MTSRKIAALLIMLMLFSLVANVPVHANPNLKDIGNHWAKTFIEQLIARGSVNGNPDGTFLPDNNISRAEFVKILTKSLGYTLEEDKAFTDTQNHWARNYIGAAVREGLIFSTEYENGLFNPNQLITRAEMARMVARALEKRIGTTQNEVTLNFKDADKISEEFKRYIAVAANNGIITGFPDGRFGPDEKATRAQACVMITKLLNIIESLNSNTNNSAQLEPDEIFSATNPAVFYLEVYDDSGNILGTGSSFIVESSGIAVTNFHVIEGASSAKAFLPDGKELKVLKVLNYDKYKDIAILQLDGKDLPTVKMGDSDNIVVGQKVLAIGSPYGLENTISNGIISSKERTIHGQKLIQTTTPISPGSSGGILLNYFGEVIGVTTLYIENGQNLNFAIPINEVKNMLIQEYKPQDLEDINAEETLSTLKGKVVSVRFYESGEGMIPEDKRVYSDKFPISTTRYVNWEIKLKYPEPGHHVDINIRAVHYYPDGSYDGEYTVPYCIEENYTESTHIGGWGYSEPGHWDSGKYKVELYIGSEKIAEKYFEIYDDLNSFSALNPEVKNLEFFESSNYMTEEDVANTDTVFEKCEARYINWLLTLEHKAPSQDISFEIRYVYYGPDNKVVAEYSDEYIIERDQTRSYHFGGIGWVIPGYWETGKYRVELFVEDEKIAQGTFKIVDNFSLSSIKGKVTELNFYESGNEGLFSDTEPAKEFDQDLTRYIHWEITINHQSTNNFIGYPIKAICYKPDGTVLSEDTGYLLIPPDSTESFGFGNFGWEKPGNWEKGVYKIELYIGDEKIAEDSFEIY